MLEPLTNDLMLLAAWHAGDRQAGEELCRVHLDVLYRFFCNKVTRLEEVSDLIGDTFLALLESRQRPSASLDRITSFRAYLLGIARHVLLGHLRAHYTQKRGAGDSTAELEETSLADLSARSMSSLVTVRRECCVLLQGLRSLPLSDQMLIEAKYFEYLTDAEIAKALQIPATSLRRRHLTAMDRLRAAVKDTSAAPANGDGDGLAAEVVAWFAEIRSQIAATCERPSGD